MIRPVLTIAVLFVATLLQGCSVFGPSVGGSAVITSIDQSKAMTPVFTTAAYSSTDSNTADIYLSDLPQERLMDPRDPLTDLSGSFVHIHVFLIPEPGATPIDATACNTTVRHLVLAGPVKTLAAASDAPALGLYAGGGFLNPDSEIGDATFGGSITDVSHRLVREGPGFKDAIGGGLMNGSFSAARNEEVSRVLGARFDQLMRLIPVVEARPEEDKGEEK